MRYARSLVLLALFGTTLVACVANPANRYDYSREMDGCEHGCDGM